METTWRSILPAVVLVFPAWCATARNPGGGGDDGQWVMPARNYESTRYSGLDEINAGNAKNLKLAWTFSTGLTRGHEAAPLIVNNTMYIVTPFPNLLYALDLTKPGRRRSGCTIHTHRSRPRGLPAATW